jgi:hypothetical protein
MIKSRRMRWEGYVAYIGNKKCIRNFSKKTKSDKEEELGLYTDKLKTSLGRVTLWVHVPQNWDGRRALVNRAM